MSCWDWITEQIIHSQRDTRIILKEKYHETVAYRRNLNRLIHENMAEYDELDKELRRVSHLEDELSDTLEKMPR